MIDIETSDRVALVPDQIRELRDIAEQAGDRQPLWIREPRPP